MSAPWHQFGVSEGRRTPNRLRFGADGERRALRRALPAGLVAPTHSRERQTTILGLLRADGWEVGLTSHFEGPGREGQEQGPRYLRVHDPATDYWFDHSDPRIDSDSGIGAAYQQLMELNRALGNWPISIQPTPRIVISDASTEDFKVTELNNTININVEQFLNGEGPRIIQDIQAQRLAERGDTKGTGLPSGAFLESLFGTDRLGFLTGSDRVRIQGAMPRWAAGEFTADEVASSTEAQRAALTQNAQVNLLANRMAYFQQMAGLPKVPDDIRADLRAHERGRGSGRWDYYATARASLLEEYGVQIDEEVSNRVATNRSMNPLSLAPTFWQAAPVVEQETPVRERVDVAVVTARNWEAAIGEVPRSALGPYSDFRVALELELQRVGGMDLDRHAPCGLAGDCRLLPLAANAGAFWAAVRRALRGVCGG